MKASVVIIEDIKEMSDLIQLYVKREGMDTTVFDNAEAALEYLKTATPDLILLDINLPGMDGFEFLNIYHKQSDCPAERHIAQSSKVVVIGQTVVTNLFGNENPIGKTIRFKNTPFQVIGVLESKGENTWGQDQDNVILAPFTTVQKRIMAITYVNSIVASAKSESVAQQAVDEVTEILRRVHKSDGTNDPFRIMSMEELLSTANSTTSILTTLLVAIAGISLLIGGIGIMNIMYVSVKERTREIGLRMAVGARSRDILLQFLTEAIFISVTGGIIGVIFGITAAKVTTIFTQWPTIITGSSLLISFLVCAVTGIFFGWYPAKKAANLDPIVALRYE